MAYVSSLKRLNNNEKGKQEMKRTKSMIYKESDESRELFLYSVNSSVLYRQSIVPIVRNLAKKYSKGIFDKEKAIDAFYYAAENGAKLYCKEFSAFPSDYVQVFSVTDRFSAAVEMADYYMENIIRNDL